MKRQLARLVHCTFLCWGMALQAVDIQFDYTYDSGGFFDLPSRRQVLELAGNAWEAQLAGVETPAIPLGTGGNTWTLKFNRPDTAATLGDTNTSLVNKPLPANTIVVYVGGRPDVYGGFLGYAEFYYTASGTNAWLGPITGRDTGTKFSSFGGAVAFDSDAAWHFDSDPSTKEEFPGQNDFYTVAMHEIGHVLGFSTGSAAFRRLTLGGKFTGEQTKKLFGQDPDMGTGGHWPGGMEFMGAGLVMRPTVGEGQRVEINPLEKAVLQDLGYRATGSLQVTLTPETARSGGAKWRLDSGALQVSGAVVANLVEGQGNVSFTPVKGFLTPADQTIQITGGGTTAIIGDYVPIPSPTVTVLPRSSLTFVGDNVTLSVQAAAGGASLSYIWKKGAVGLSGVTGSSNVLSPVGLGQAGVYTVEVKSEGGSAGRFAANVGVVGSVNAPTLVNEGASTRISVAAAGPGLEFQWFKDGVPVVNDAVLGVTGANTASLAMKKVDAGSHGEYRCRVRMPDASGGPVLEYLTVGHTLSVRLRPVVNSLVLGPWRVSGAVTDLLTAQNGPTLFQVTGLPNGVRLDKATGQLSGRPLSAKTYRLGVTASNSAGSSLVRYMDVVCEDFVAHAKGSFSGLIERGLGNGGLGGAIAFDVSSGGILTGRLSMGSESRSFTGAWETSQGPNPKAQFEVKRSKAQLPWQVVVEVEATTGRLTGSVSETLQPSATIEGFQSHWDARRLPAAGYVGSYSIALMPDSASGIAGFAPRVPAEAISSPKPQGVGYAFVKVTSGGAVNWNGKLSDGTTLTRSLRLARDGGMPFHGLLYAGTGSIQGRLVITLDPVQWKSTRFDGEMDWIKRDQGSTKSRLYPRGFSLHRVTAVGGAYSPQDSVSAQLKLPMLAENAELTFAGAEIETAGQATEVGVRLGISPTNRIQGPPVSGNPTKTRLISISTSTALFRGDLTLRDPKPSGMVGFWDRKVLFYGMLVPRLDAGLGWFLLEQLGSGDPSPVQSGLVLLDAVP